MAISIFLNFEKLSLEIAKSEIAQMTNDNLPEGFEDIHHEAIRKNALLHECMDWIMPRKAHTNARLDGTPTDKAWGIMSVCHIGNRELLLLKPGGDQGDKGI